MAASGGSGLRVSAPGKVLLTGGYLILEEQFSGLVLATSARFHSTISRRRVAGSAVDLEKNVLLRIRVESPQFHQVIVAYAVRVEDDRLDVLVADESDRNAYIEETLLCALNGAVGLNASAFYSMCDALRANAEELYVRLEADNAFYSQVTRLRQSGKELLRRSLAELPAFMPPVLEADASTGKTSIAKTGLGSSAALVTSLVGAILQFFLQYETGEKREDGIERDLIHNLAQLSHCFVQRKIGSGFDVSAASYGTQLYSRFPPSMLDAFTTRDGLKPNSIANCIHNEALWKRSTRVQPFSFPLNFHLLMGDVSTGSATVSMVKQVLQWQKSNPAESARVIGRLAAANAAVEHSFRALGVLSAANPTEFGHKCAEMAQKTAEQWFTVDPTIGGALFELRNHYQAVRQCFREMGELAGVPIEPREQTALIDATLTVPGVLFAGVPGAGGYDALFVLTLDGSTLDRVEKLWLEWVDSHPDTVICPLLCDVAPSSGSALSVE